MHSRKSSRYPHPPPSLVIKPSAHNSPSRVQPSTSRLTSSTSTPERMKVGQKLANQIYLGNSPNNVITKRDDGVDDLLTISIQDSESPEPKLKYRSQSMSLDKHLTCNTPISSLSSSATDSQIFTEPRKTTSTVHTNGQVDWDDSEEIQQRLVDQTKKNGYLPHKSLTPDMKTKSAHTTILRARSFDFQDDTADVRPKETPTAQTNGHISNNVEPNNHVANGTESKNSAEKVESNRAKKSTLRKNFFENYPKVIVNTFKTKKKVSFALPKIERDISDISISSHLSAISDCVVLEDDDEPEEQH